MKGVKFFDQRPRKDPKALFGRGMEISRVVRAFEANSWVAILGPRMVGKTSLAIAGSHMFSEKNGYNVVFVDLRNSTTSRQATERILSRLPESIINRVAKYLSGVSLGAGGLSGSIRLRQHASASRALEDALFELDRTILILDEIQNIVQGVVPFMRALATAFNENDTLLVVFTGSYAGVLRKLFETSPRDEPYGRPPIQITVSPWPEFTALDFLKRGLTECGVGYTDNELGMVLWKLGTLPGWLNLYGLRRCLGDSHEEALSSVFSMGIKDARRELENFIAGRTPKVRTALKMLSYGATWGELLRKTAMSKETLSRLLDALMNELFIVAKDEVGVYRISDPLYRYAAERL